MNKDLNHFTPKLAFPFYGSRLILIYWTNGEQSRAIIAKNMNELATSFKQVLTKYHISDVEINGYWRGNIVAPPNWWIEQGRKHYYNQCLESAKKHLLSNHMIAYMDTDIVETEFAIKCPYKESGHYKLSEQSEDDREFEMRYHNYCRNCDSFCWILKSSIDFEELFWKCFIEEYMNDESFGNISYENAMQGDSNKPYHQWHTDYGHHHAGVTTNEMNKEDPYFGYYHPSTFIFQGERQETPNEIVTIYNKLKEENKEKQDKFNKRAENNAESRRNEEMEKALEYLNKIKNLYFSK